MSRSKACTVTSLGPTILLALLVVASGCGKADEQKGSPRPSQPTQEEIWAASKFCGDEKPETPVDPTPEHRFDIAFLNAKLGAPGADGGLVGWMHGVVPQYKQYVFTYRKQDPNDFMAFFKAQQFSLVPATDEVAVLLAGLRRHDKVRLYGRVFDNSSPLVHLKISAVRVLEEYEGATENSYDFDFSPYEDKPRFDAFGIVHATVASPEFGHALIVEFHDTVLPVAVPEQFNEAAAGIYRGDIVNLALRTVVHEHGPPHFELDKEAANAVQVIDPILNCHNRQTTVTGFLAKFVKSPAINTDVYAVRVVDSNGIARNFTLFPDTDDEAKFESLFNALSTKAKDGWEDAAEAPQVVRNFWKKESVLVRATGRLNVVSSEQANAQVYMKSADDLTVTTRP